LERGNHELKGVPEPVTLGVMLSEPVAAKTGAPAWMASIS
jgi:hypothetical protein